MFLSSCLFELSRQGKSEQAVIVEISEYSRTRERKENGLFPVALPSLCPHGTGRFVDQPPADGVLTGIIVRWHQGSCVSWRFSCVVPRKETTPWQPTGPLSVAN